jgi:hypothetical protein
MAYFVLALWLFRGRNCGYGQVMAKLADGLYCQQRGADLLVGKLAPGLRVDGGGGRQWWLPNISSLRGRGKLGADPLRMLFEHVAGPTGEDGAPGVFCCGLRVVSMDGSVTDVPDSEKNAAFFGRPSNQSRDGAFPQARWVAAAESGTGSLLGAAGSFLSRTNVLILVADAAAPRHHHGYVAGSTATGAIRAVRPLTPPCRQDSGSPGHSPDLRRVCGCPRRRVCDDFVGDWRVLAAARVARLVRVGSGGGCLVAGSLPDLFPLAASLAAAQGGDGVGSNDQVNCPPRT